MPTPEARQEERRKFDRHPAYVYFHVGVLLVALGITVSGAPPSGAIGQLSWETQQFLGMCMLIGSASALIGACMGSPWFRRDSMHHPLDLRFPYAWALSGLMGVGVSMWAYFVVIATSSSVIGTLSGGLTVAFGVMSIHMGVRFAHQIVTRTRMRGQLTREYIRERDNTRRDKSRDAVRDKARDNVRDAEHDAAHDNREQHRNRARDDIRDPIRDQARDPIRDQARDQASEDTP
jgi:hypothetical protein